jgi:molybdopterin-synthase adenylyltransferase
MSRLARQSFLGANSDALLDGATIGLVGLGGGGSHVGQQLAHLGIGGYVLVDPQAVDDTNTNRLVGGTLADLGNEHVPASDKVVISDRLIRGLKAEARIRAIVDSWHNATDYLKRCDVIVGSVDSYIERDQLERFARRHLIPYIDIGMDVHALPASNFLISGQVVLSMPAAPCLRCLGIVTDERLQLEAAEYGSAGPRPQVVWPNGILASSAVGLLVQLLTPWCTGRSEVVYLEYDGNRGTLRENERMTLLRDKTCPHHPVEEVGDPFFDIRRVQLHREAGRAGDDRHFPLPAAPQGRRAPVNPRRP